ncbi:hypothetical protein GCM10010170_043530 [Dactylosporangium salmoneum]|uniref:Uncharacterized protein n=1 Tax=Dactylosporangium salmoneum TaxID=53361 RepID=A0ABN3GJ05_9ACTN
MDSGPRNQGPLLPSDNGRPWGASLPGPRCQGQFAGQTVENGAQPEVESRGELSGDEFAGNGGEVGILLSGKRRQE